MQNIFFAVNRPSVYMHTSPDIKSEVCDELLYGTEFKKISSKDENGYFRCETSYGYSGYLHRKYIHLLPSGTFSHTYIVTANSCDVLPSDEYRQRPITTLPKGSIIHTNRFLSPESRFLGICHGSHRCFVRTDSVRPYTPYDEKMRLVNELAVRKRICDDALSYIGVPYRWGGKSSYGIDCSGLCFMSYFLNGITLWRDAFADSRYVYEISEHSLMAGDIIYFKGHAAVYIGDGEYVHSSASTGYVTVNSIKKSSILYRDDLAGKIICFARSKLF